MPGPQTSFMSNQFIDTPEAQQLTVQVQSWANAVATLQVRGMTARALLSHDHVTTSDRAVSTTVFRCTDFPIFLRINHTGANFHRGECYVKVTLQCAGFDVGVLCAGYITNEFFPAYPGGFLEDPSNGRGVLREILGDDPAVGAEISQTVPTNTQWRFIAMSATLVTEAVVATRFPRLNFTTGGNIQLDVPMTNGVAISSSKLFTWAAIGNLVNLTAVWEIQPSPANFLLDQGTVVSTLTRNLQAGDNWSAPVLTVEEWIQE